VQLRWRRELETEGTTFIPRREHTCSEREMPETEHPAERAPAYIWRAVLGIDLMGRGALKR
jgi:hypothetical protein